MHRRIYLITGATGTTGSSLVEKLAAAEPENEIRAATRNPQSPSAQHLLSFGENVRLVQFDLKSEALTQNALSDVTHLYVLPPFIPAEMVQWHVDLMSAAAKYADLQYAVKHSVIGARLPQDGDQPSGIPLIHGYGEKAIQDAGVPMTALRPTIFAQHFLTNRAIFEPGADHFYLPVGSTKVAFIDARDIATAAAHLLTLDDPSEHVGQAYTLTGPAGVTVDEMGQALSDATGKPITWQDVSDDKFVERLEAAGRPGALINIYIEAREGWFADPTPDFEQIVGRKGTLFAQFIADYSDYFTGSN